MADYSDILNTYSFEMYLMFSSSISENEWGNREVAFNYLEKYFLSEDEYLQRWKPIQNLIFQNELVGLPEVVFQNEYSMLPFRGGVLFEKHDFENLQRSLKTLGEENFVIIQNDFGGLVERPILRMKYPVNVTWEGLMSGNFISTVIFNMPANEYFVFSESKLWGQYCGNDYKLPLNLIGFKPEVESVFKECLVEEYKEGRDELREWLPLKYRELISEH